MSLLDKWGISQKATPAISATPAIPGREHAIHGADTGVLAAPGIADPLRPLAIPGATGRMPQKSDPRNRSRSQTTCDSWNRGNSGVLGQNTHGSQQSQESQRVDSDTLSMSVPPNGDTKTVATIAGIAAPRSQDFAIDSLPASLKAAFEERAAITEVDGGLDRKAAERLAWDEVNAGPIGDTLKAWRAWMNCRMPFRMARGLPRTEAMQSVWAEAECIWHCRHGAPPDPDRCAGCGEWMLDGPGMRFSDGAVVHLGNPDRFDCLILYGQEWRATASAGLIALGLKRPEP
jgi:hypothetical protein